MQEPTVEEVWRTDAGAHLFNGITQMNLVRGDQHILFSERLRLTHAIIDLLIEEGLRPEDMTQRIGDT